MKYCFRILWRATGVAAFLISSTTAYAATCNTVGSSGSVAFSIAVASNFYAPLNSLATTYANSQGYKITLCQDSSGNLYNSIVPSNSPQYAIFFSADTSKPADVVTQKLNYASPVNYAKGIPAFVLSPNAYAATSGSYRAANYLTTALAAGSGASAVRSSSSLPAIPNYVKLKRSPSSPAVTYLAVGDPSVAPYGVAAGQIMGRDSLFTNNMHQWPGDGSLGTAGSNVSANCSAFLSAGQWVCKYSNIDYTLQAVANNRVTAGFVSYAQVCSVWAGSAYAADQYVLFPDYYTTQAYVELTVTSTTAQAYATAFLSYLGVGGSSWNTWLTNNCYKSL